MLYADMAKTAAVTTLPPSSFIEGPIVQEHLQDLVEMQNWIRVNRPKTYLNLNCDNDAGGSGSWDNGDGQELMSLGLEMIGAGASYQTRIDVGIITGPDVSQLKVGVRCAVPIGSNLDVRVRYFVPPGSTADAVLTFGNADNGSEKTATIDISSIKEADDDTVARIQVQVRANTSPSSGIIRNVRVMDDVSAWGTPSPVL